MRSGVVAEKGHSDAVPLRVSASGALAMWTSRLS
jgi:hypothetical protein